MLFLFERHEALRQACIAATLAIAALVLREISSSGHLTRGRSYVDLPREQPCCRYVRTYTRALRRRPLSAVAAALVGCMAMASVCGLGFARGRRLDGEVCRHLLRRMRPIIYVHAHQHRQCKTAGLVGR
ncbi:unnamed protein product [Ectocarpus sp. 4 AP-2014]